MRYATRRLGIRRGLMAATQRDEFYDDLLNTLDTEGVNFIDIGGNTTVCIEVRFEADDYNDGELVLYMLTDNDTIIYKAEYGYKKQLDVKTIKRIVKKFIDEMNSTYLYHIKETFKI